MLAFVSVVSRVNARGEASSAERTCDSSSLEERPQPPVGFFRKVVALLLWLIAEAVRWVRELDAKKVVAIITTVLCWNFVLEERERMMMLCGALGYLCFKPLAERPHMATVTCL